MSKRLTCSEILEDSQGELDTQGAFNRQESSPSLRCYRCYRGYFIAELIIGSIFLVSEAIALAFVTFENPDDAYRSIDYQVDAYERSSIPREQVYPYRDWADFAPQIHVLLKLRYLIMCQIVSYAVQLMIQLAAVRTGHRRFYSIMFLPIILNIFISCALIALDLTFFCAPVVFSFVDLIFTFGAIKSLT